MIIYIDLLIVINYIFDFCLLLTTDLILKRNASMKRILLGSLFGEISLLILFLHLNNVIGLILKIIMAVCMVIIVFKYKSIKYTFLNTIYMFLSSIILGGFIYYMVETFTIDLTLGFKYIFIIVLSLVFLLFYYKFTIKFKNDYNNRYKVIIEYNNIKFKGTGFLDSGNKLISPYGNKPIILVEKSYISLKKLKLLPVYYNALNHKGILYCFKPNKVFINNKEYNNILIGLSDFSFNMEGCEILLNSKMLI